MIKVIHWADDSPQSKLDQSLARYLQQQGYWVNRKSYAPGTELPAHSFNVDIIDAVLRGRMRLIIHGESVELGAGDYLEIPRGTLHSAAVVGDEPLLTLDAIRLLTH